ncbi:MAG: hypothetical protein JW843_06360 [Candidatus Aminicenantes bacterium]|nr:hypothetical protein [Candidatus Aminicenantes bacterium]
MASKRPTVAALLAALCVCAASAQWRETAREIVSKGGDFRSLGGQIAAAYSELPETEKADAAALGAFCAARTGETTEEIRWLVEFFEGGRALDSGFVFLDFSGQAILSTYLNGWRVKYPWVRNISLIKGTKDEIIIPEGTIPLAVEISIPAFYKFFEGEKVVKAGAFQAGFNVLGLEANALFRESRTRTYFLEVKSGSLVLRREFTLDVRVSWPTAPKPKAPEAPKVGKLARALGSPDPPAPDAPPIIREYNLSLFVGGNLLMSSQKSETVKPLKLDILPSNHPAFLKPDWNIKRNDPWANPGMNTFSILDAIGIVGGLLKDLFRKKTAGEANGPQIQTVRDLSLDFKFRGVEGRPLEMNVEMSLRPQDRPTIRWIY